MTTNRGKYSLDKSIKLAHQIIHVEPTSTFNILFPNIFQQYRINNDYHEGSTIKKRWLEHPMRLWQIQLNFATYCATTSLGISRDHLKSPNPFLGSIYNFHAYYHIRRILARMEAPTPLESGYDRYNNNYSRSVFF